MSSTDESEGEQRSRRKARKPRSKSHSSSGYESTHHHHKAGGRHRPINQRSLGYNPAAEYGLAAGLASMRALYAVPYDPAAVNLNPMMLAGLYPQYIGGHRGSRSPDPAGFLAMQMRGQHHHHGGSALNHHVIGPYPVELKCPQCKENVVTILDHKPGTYSYSMALVFAGLGCFCGCCLIPLRRKDYQDVYHQCPECHTWVGHYKRWYGPPHYSLPIVLKEGPRGKQPEFKRKNAQDSKGKSLDDLKTSFDKIDAKSISESSE